MMNRQSLAWLIVVLCAGTGSAAPPSASWFPKAPPLPPPSGAVIHVRDVNQLQLAIRDVRPGGTILLSDGHYLLPNYLEIATDNVTLRSASGNRDRVILDAARSRHGELLGFSQCSGVVVADLTIQNVKWNGFKINCNRGATRITIYNCVIHNVWQRGVKGVAVPEDQQIQLSPRDCRIQFCLFYNDRPKSYSDDETDTPQSFKGNYIGGIDAKNTIDWTITDNVFLGIRGRTGEGRGCVFIWDGSSSCTIERNVFIDCDIAIAMGNPTRSYTPLHAIGCVVQNNLIVRCGETGILTCYTRDCQIQHNTILDPQSRLGRLIWVLQENDRLQIANNRLVGPPIRINSDSELFQYGNTVSTDLDAALVASGSQDGQSFLAKEAVEQAIAFKLDPVQPAAAAAQDEPPLVSPEAVTDPAITADAPSWTAAMRAIHQGFDGQRGYVAQFGDSITYSMAFWSPMDWHDPSQYLTEEDGLPKTPPGMRWRDFVKGARDKGPTFANYSGWTVAQVLRAMDEVLQRERPEVAIIMIGSNDISGGQLPASYRANLAEVIRKCLRAQCVPILNTIPPRRGRDAAVAAANTVIRQLARTHQVPLVDYHAECLRRRPGQTWDGTIISADGVHPTAGKSNEYTEENMQSSGYALRNWVNFLVLRQVYFHVLESGGPAPTDQPVPRVGDAASGEQPQIQSDWDASIPADVVFAPRVLSPLAADAYSLNTFARFGAWSNLRDDQLAYQVYSYLADTKTGLFHMDVVSEGADPLDPFGQVRDPVKIINVYGYGYCGIFGPVMAGVCEGMGIGPGRAVSLPAWKHLAAEAFYDGAWHYLDADVRAAFRRDDGSLASVEQARGDASLWRNRGPLFFPNDPLESTRAIYQKTPIEYYYGFQQLDHTMDFVLRPGEQLTRWWQPQGGRWHHLASYNRNSFLRRLLESEPRGPKPNHRHFTVHNHGNGRFVYQPNLTDQSLDFERGVYELQNVAVSAAGLTVEQAGDGFAIFEVRSPYVIVPLVGDMDTIEDDREASVIELDDSGATLSISTDNGLTWVALPPGQSTYDLTPHVSGRYGYLLKISLSGNPGAAIVRSLKMTTWVQLAPAALPALARGVNQMQLVTGDHYDLNSRVVEVRSDSSDADRLLKYLVEPPRDYDPGRNTSRIQGTITAKIAAPPGTKIAWFRASGQFRTHQHQAAQQTRNRIAYAVDRPDDFQTIYEADVPTYAQHWHYNASREIQLTEPADVVYVRYVGDPAINNFTIRAHCIDERPHGASPVQIRHVWRENGQRKESIVRRMGAGNYTIETTADPEDELIEISVPSTVSRN